MVINNAKAEKKKLVKEYKKELSFDKRKDESSKILSRYPERVPIIAEVSTDQKDLHLDKKKYLCPHDLTFGQFNHVIRKRINLKPEEAMFIFVGNKLVPTAELMGNVYKYNKDKDGFLYLSVSKENTFG